MGVTYSYKTTVFFGKAALQGIYSPTAKSLIIKETKMLDLKTADQSEPCLMTCYLDYSRIGKLETLSGTFISVNAKDKGDCGSGKVYLEKVPVSDFKKEDFLSQKPVSPSRPPANLQNQAHPETSNAKTVVPGKSIPKTTTPEKKPATQPNTNTASQHKPAASTPKNSPEKSITGHEKQATKPQTVTVQTAPHASPDKSRQEGIATARGTSPTNADKTAELKAAHQLPIPRVLLERTNNLVKTINISEPEIEIDLYDNGTIDNDSISVYHNNELVVSHARLTYTPIVVKIKCTREDDRHEITIVAENLGDIPPNSALMVVKAGRERHEVSLDSNEQMNAKVVIQYVPKKTPEN